MTDRQAALARLAIPGAALCGCALLDPRNPPAGIFCPFRLVTGIPCPLCGITRGLAALVRADITTALQFHALSPLVLAGMAAWIVADAGQAARLWNAARIGEWALRPALWIVLFTLCLAYGALRWCGILGYPPA
jgi:hypothetical protein